MQKYSIERIMSYCPEASICRAARVGALDIVRFLLDAGTPVDSRDNNGDTLLVCLLSWRCTFSKREKKRQFIKEIINMGACVNTVNFAGEWTLHVAVRGSVQGYVAKKTIKRLVQAGSFVCTLNEEGLTPQNIAFCGGLADIGEYLLFRGMEQDTAIFYSFIIPTAPVVEEEEEEDFIHECKDKRNQGDYEHLVWKKPRIDASAPSKEYIEMYSSDAFEPEEDELECDICIEVYQYEIPTFGCFRCRRSMCRQCKLQNVMETCPFCTSKVYYRNKDLEWRVKQLHIRSEVPR